MVVDLGAIARYPENRQSLDRVSTEDTLALCIYHSVPHADLRTLRA